jgi:hypothetical protein
MLAKTDVAKIYETLLSIPGMGDPVKISLSIPRKNVLLLSKVIERGLSGKDGEDKTTNVLDIVPKENLQELLSLSADILSKAGLTEMNQRLQSL